MNSRQYGSSMSEIRGQKSEKSSLNLDDISPVLHYVISSNTIRTTCSLYGDQVDISLAFHGKGPAGHCHLIKLMT